MENIISNFLTEVTDTDKMYKTFNEFNNEINELKSDYLAGQDEDINDVIENASIVYNNQLNFFWKLYRKDEPGLSSIQLPSQKTTAERVKLRSQKVVDKDFSDMSLLKSDEEEVKEGKRLKILIPNKLLTRLPILLAQIKVENNSYKLKNEIRQILCLLHQHNKIITKVYNNLMKSWSQS